MHYRRVIRYGGPGPATEIGNASSLETRFLNAVHPYDTCHLWRGSISKNGYGTIGLNAKSSTLTEWPGNWLTVNTPLAESCGRAATGCVCVPTIYEKSRTC